MHPRVIGLAQDHGFTLAETAIVLTVVAIMIGALVPSFLSIRIAEQGRVTTQNLQSVMRSIAAFVQSSGCVPCPTPASSSSGNGQGFVAGGNGVACGACVNPVGLVPFRSLGLPESFAKDAYGHWLTYAVDKTLAGYVAKAPLTQIPVSGANGMCSLTLAAASPLNVKLYGGNTQNNIAVMLLSHGANGYGAYRNNPESDTDRLGFPASSPSCSGSVGAERCNASDTINFVATLAGQSNDPFDDVFLYLDRNSLVSYLGNPGCTGEWR